MVGIAAWFEISAGLIPRSFSSKDSLQECHQNVAANVWAPPWRAFPANFRATAHQKSCLVAPANLTKSDQKIPKVLSSKGSAGGRPVNRIALL